MKKNALGIYIIMIIIGVAGLFFYINQNRTPVVQPVAQAEPQETISVAVALRNLEAGSILQAADFKLTSISVASGSAALIFNISGNNPANYALKSAVSAESYIPPSALVKPGSDDYLAMFMKPGSVIYSFSLDNSDSYLLHNLKPGQGIDVYLSYSLDTASDEIISPARSIRDSRMKILMKDKRVLSVRPATMVNKNGVEIVEKGSQIVVELQHYEIKMLKELQDKNARILLFPSVDETLSADKITNSVLPGNEVVWPVKDDEIFNKMKSPQEAINDVNELRG